MKKWGIMASCQRENGLLLCWGLSLDLSFLGPSCKRQTIQQSRGPGFFNFFFFTLAACVATQNEELGLFHAWLGPASITKNNGELPCLLASSSQVHGRGAWFFQFFFSVSNRASQVSDLCVLQLERVWIGGPVFFFRFAVSSILAILYFYIGLWSQNRSNHAWYMNKAAKGRQKLQHPVFPPSLLRQYWLGQHLFTYPDRTGWGAFRCVWP